MITYLKKWQFSYFLNRFTIKVKKGLPPKNTGLKVECFNVEMAGMISHPTDDEVKIALTKMQKLIILSLLTTYLSEKTLLFFLASFKAMAIAVFCFLPLLTNSVFHN